MDIPHSASTRTPPTASDIEQLVVRMATENPSWGYTRILGAISNLGIQLGRGTIQRILKNSRASSTPQDRGTLGYR